MEWRKRCERCKRRYRSKRIQEKDETKTRGLEEEIEHLVPNRLLLLRKPQLLPSVHLLQLPTARVEVHLLERHEPRRGPDEPACLAVPVAADALVRDVEDDKDGDTDLQRGVTGERRR